VLTSSEWGRTSHITQEQLDEHYMMFPSDAPRKWRVEHGFEGPERTAPAKKAEPPEIPVGYGPEEASGVAGLQGTDGILAEKGASGVLICGGGDVRRGRVAAELLMEAYKLNGGLWGAFVDYPGLLDRCRASPLYGEASRAAIIAEHKKKGILTLHAIDVAITDRYGGEVLGEIVRSRNVRRQTTILTARMSWQELERQAAGKRELVEYLEDCIALPGTSGLNVLTLD